MTPWSGGELRRDVVLVAGAWLALVVALSVWLTLDRRPPAWAEADGLERAVRCAAELGGGQWRALFDRDAPQPPIISCAAGILYRLYPSDVAAPQAVILLALGIGMMATYLLAHDLGGAAAAVPAAVMFGTAPLAIHAALRFRPDVPLAASVSLALLALARTDRFQRVGVSVLAGVVLGIGMLVSPTFALYVAPAIVWLLVLERNRRGLVNGVVTVLIAAGISLPWYVPRMLLPSAAVPRAVQATLRESVASLLPQLGVLTIVLVVIGLVAAAVRARGFAIVSFLVPLGLVLLTGVDPVHGRLPLLPAAAVLVGMAIATLPAPARATGLAAVAVVGAVQVSAVAWGVPKAIALPTLDVAWVVQSPPSPDDWRHRDVLRAIATDSGARPVTVSVLPNHPAFSANNFRYYARRDRLPFAVVPAWDTAPIGIDYVVVKSGDVGPQPTDAGGRALAQLAGEPALARVYPMLAEFPLPDGSTAAVRVRRVPDGVAASPEALGTALEAGIRRRLAGVAREVDNLGLRIEHDAEIVRGRVKRIELAADTAVLADYRRPEPPRLRVRRLTVVAENVLVNPFALESDGRADLLDVGRLRLAQAEVIGDDAQAFLGQLRSFRRTRVRLVADAIYVTARQPGADLSAVIRLVPGGDRRVAVRVDRASVGWVPLPTGLLNWVVRDYDPVGRFAQRLPFPVEIGPVALSDHALRVGP